MVAAEVEKAVRKMKALSLGCGLMGQVAIKDLVEYGDFDEVTVGDIDLRKSEKFIEGLRGVKPRLSARFVDVSDIEKLIALMREFDVVVSCVGPFYKFGLDVVKAAIEAKVSFVDICDDYGVTGKVLELDPKAKKAGVTIITGLGTSPGITNLLAKAGAEALDEVEEIHTAFLISGPDAGGPAEISHRLHSMYGKVPTFRDGKFVEVRALVDGKEMLEFPPLGKFEARHVGHPEPITLPRYIKGVKHVDCKGAFNPPMIREMILMMGDMGLYSDEPIKVKDASVKPVDFAVAFLRKACVEAKDVPKEGGIRVEVKGKRDGKNKGLIYSGTGTMGPGTGVPASIGAQMIAEGKIKAKGVFAPEGCIDTADFLSEIMKREVGELNIEEINK